MIAPNRPHLVVIGNGMVGHRFCEEMVARDGQQQFRIHVFCEEPRLAYDRVGLSKYFSGTPVADLMLGTIEWYQEHGIETHIGDRATAIQREQGIVTSQRGKAIEYDRLVTGHWIRPFRPAHRRRRQRRRIRLSHDRRSRSLCRLRPKGTARARARRWAIGPRSGQGPRRYGSGNYRRRIQHPADAPPDRRRGFIVAG